MMPDSGPNEPNSEKVPSTPIDPVDEMVLQRFMAFASREIGTQESLIDRLSGPQITKLLDQADAADERAHTQIMSSRREASINFRIVVIAGASLLIALVWLFLHYGNAEQLREIIALLLGAGVGGAGGYGYGMHKGKTQG